MLGAVVERVGGFPRMRGGPWLALKPIYATSEARNDHFRDTLGYFTIFLKDEQLNNILKVFQFALLDYPLTLSL